MIQSTPTGQQGVWAKAARTAPAGFALAPTQDTDLPVLRKTDAPLTGLRFTGERETDTCKQIQWSAGKEGHKPLSLAKAAATTRAWSQGPGCFSFSLQSTSVPSATFSPRRIPASHPSTPGIQSPGELRQPIICQDQKSSNQSWCKVRGRELWHPMEAYAIKNGPKIPGGTGRRTAVEGKTRPNLSVFKGKEFFPEFLRLLTDFLTPVI